MPAYPKDMPTPGQAAPLQPMSLTANLVLAQHQGRQAALAGTDFRTCPYRARGTDDALRAAWLRGWTQTDAGRTWMTHDDDDDSPA